jgi:carboxymethylenebutenolidase
LLAKPSRILALVALLALGSCKKKEAPAPPPAPAPPAVPQAKPEPPKPPPPAQPAFGFTGAISEEEFKAMHQLKTEPTPPRKGEMVTVEGERAYLSLPKGAKPGLPGVVVIQEWWGLNDNIMHWADRIAAEGYAALAVDLYQGKVATTPSAAMGYMKALTQKHATKVLLAAHKFLSEDPRIRAKRRGSIGWCMGGAASLRLAMAAPDLDAAVIYYGMPKWDPEKLKRIRAPLLGIWANQDKHITPAAVDRLEAALQQAGVRHQFHRFDADHAFGNPSQKVYDPKAAAAAWEKARAFLAEHLKR